MSTNRRKDSKASLIMPVGWLFADLLLALAMIFLVANTIQPPSPPKPTPTPKPTKVIVKPTPTVAPRIVESTYCQITLNVDSNGLVNDSPSAIADVEKQIRSNSYLNGRRAGLAIAYGGTPNANDTDTPLTVAKQIYKVLDMLGKGNFVFIGTSYFDPLFYIGWDYSHVAIDIYLLVRQGKENTCNAQHQPI